MFLVINFVVMCITFKVVPLLLFIMSMNPLLSVKSKPFTVYLARLDEYVEYRKDLKIYQNFVYSINHIL